MSLDDDGIAVLEDPTQSRQGLNSGIDWASLVSLATPLFDRTLAIPNDDP